jgi:hypothetical protein
LPAFQADAELDLFHFLGVHAHRVAARAESTIDRAGIERQKEGFVRIAVGEAGNRRVGLLVQRVETELRVIRQKARAERDELCAQRVGIRILPVDEGHDVRRDSHAHRSALKSHRGVLHEILGNDAFQALEQLFHPGNGIFALPRVVEKCLFANFGIGRDPAPKSTRSKNLMTQTRRIDRRFLGRERIVGGQILLAGPKRNHIHLCIHNFPRYELRDKQSRPTRARGARMTNPRDRPVGG